VDHLILVTDPSQRGVIAAKRIVEMVPGLEVNIKHMHLVVNRVAGAEMAPALAAAVREIDVELVGTIPNDLLMSEFEFSGRPLVQLPDDSPVVQGVFKIADKILSNGL
jgi:CO dehydrogenase maturation factor